MSKGNNNDYGNKKKNFPFQQSLLLINGAIQAAAQAGAKDATLQLVLTALQNGQDYEAKLVRDSDVPSVTWLEVRIFNVTTGAFDPPVYYLAGSNTVGSPVLPVIYIDPTTILATIASNTSDNSTETTLAALLTELQLKADLTDTQPVSAVSLPLPTGAATSALQTALNGLVATAANQVLELALLTTIDGDTSNMVGILTAIDSVLDAIKVDTAAMVADLAAIEVLLTGASRTPSIVTATTDGTTVAGVKGMAIWVRGTGGTIDGEAVPSGARFSWGASDNDDTMEGMDYTVPTGEPEEMIITYLT